MGTPGAEPGPAEPRSESSPEESPGVARDAERIDVAVYAAIARTPTPALDTAMNRVSGAADYSKLWVAAAALQAVLGGRRGRRAAVAGLASVGVAAAVANLALKPLGGRRRPERVVEQVPVARWARMPGSTAFPSGHSASAFAYATESATSSRSPRSRCSGSPPWSRIRASTSGCTIPATSSRAPWSERCSPAHHPSA